MAYLPKLHTLEETRSWVADVLLRRREVWVADDGGVVGFLALEGSTVDHLYVPPSAQARGVGSGLLAVAKERRPGGLRLWVFQANEGARRFYERHGFELVRITDGAANEERLPDALYAWRGEGSLRSRE